MTTFVTDPQQLWRGIVGLAERLRQRGPVDYRARRQALASWAGLTSRHRESDTVVRRGPITKQGSTLVRWAAVEAAHGTGHAGWLSEKRAAIAGRRGRNIATVAVACKLLTLVYYGLRDGHIAPSPRRHAPSWMTPERWLGGFRCSTHVYRDQ
jgi:hypothetical protein